MSESTEVSELSKQRQMEMAHDPVGFPKFVPTVFVGHPLDPNHYCRAWNSKREKYCSARAGQNTDHLGSGRCAWHGGLTPIKSGIYSSVERDSLKEHLAKVRAMDDEIRLDMGPEIQMIRALAADYLQRFDETVDALHAWNADEALEAHIDGRKPRPQRIPNIHEVAKLLKTAAELVDKTHNQLHRDSIPKRDFFRLQEAMGDVVKEVLTGLEKQVGQKQIDATITEIQDKWLEIQL